MELLLFVAYPRKLKNFTLGLFFLTKLLARFIFVPFLFMLKRKEKKEKRKRKEKK